MSTSKNKGEWSELYTFLKLLADGKLYCGDGRLNRYDDRFYPILEVFRNDAPDRISYKVQAAKNNILVSGQMEQFEVPQERFRTEATRLLNHIKRIRGVENNEDIERFMAEIKCTEVCAKSTDKADIRIVIHNLHTGSKPELGYSIKSRLGGEATLINASNDNTNFIYQIDGLNHSLIGEINSQKYFRDKFRLINSCNATISFKRVAEKCFHNNLTMLDLGMERIIAESLLYYYSSGIRTIENAVALITKNDPLDINCNEQPIYEYKVKQFLLAFALGMTAATPWQGKFNANGGYIVVKEDGDVICYHFFDRNDLEDYMFYNTCFDTPSTKKHQFGKIYEEDGELFIKLNLQVRFIK